MNPTSSIKEKKQFDKYVAQGKDIFVFFYLEGCGPCNATKPEWKKMENVLSSKYKNNDHIVLAEIDQSIMKDLCSIKMIQPKGFPSIHHITKKGKHVKEYENDELLDIKDRSVDSFVKWIETNLLNMKKNPNRKFQHGGKWSIKYKRSINCRNPRGFSQKQHCKYGRTKKNRARLL